MSDDISPLPWHVGPYNGVYSIGDTHEHSVLSLGFAKGMEEKAKANSAFICLAVNSHEALVSALRAADLMLSLLPVRDDSEEKARREVKDAARAALKKAEGAND